MCIHTQHYTCITYLVCIHITQAKKINKTNTFFLVLLSARKTQPASFISVRQSSSLLWSSLCPCPRIHSHDMTLLSAMWLQKRMELEFYACASVCWHVDNTICIQMFTHVQLYHFHFRTVNTFIFRMVKRHHFEGKDNWVAFTHRI